jgi:hypothetical protein
MTEQRLTQDALTEALFVSDLQPRMDESSDSVRRAVITALLRDGVAGCEAGVAQEFGDHPDAAVARMNWAIRTVRKQIWTSIR